MENRYRTKFFGESIPKEDGYFVSDFNDAIQNGKNVKMKDDGLVSKKTPVKVKMKIRDFEAIIYKMIENTAASWYNGQNWVCYALPA